MPMATSSAFFLLQPNAYFCEAQLPTAYCLLLTAYCLLLIVYCLLLIQQVRLPNRAASLVPWPVA
jgi:hypothetical protein